MNEWMIHIVLMTTNWCWRYSRLKKDHGTSQFYEGDSRVSFKIRKCNHPWWPLCKIGPEMDESEIRNGWLVSSRSTCLGTFWLWESAMPWPKPVLPTDYGETIIDKWMYQTVCIKLFQNFDWIKNFNPRWFPILWLILSEILSLLTFRDNLVFATIQTVSCPSCCCCCFCCCYWYLCF